MPRSKRTPGLLKLPPQPQGQTVEGTVTSLRTAREAVSEVGETLEDALLSVQTEDKAGIRQAADRLHQGKDEAALAITALPTGHDLFA